MQSQEDPFPGSPQAKWMILPGEHESLLVPGLPGMTGSLGEDRASHEEVDPGSQGRESQLLRPPLCLLQRLYGVAFMAWYCRDRPLLLPAAGSDVPSRRRPQGPSLAIFTVVLLLPLSCFASGCPEVCSCSTGEVNCMEHRLRFVPDGLPANATAILLDYNRISTLRNRTFVAQNALLRLSLRSNLLVNIHRQALAGLSQLQELDLSGNYLSLLQPETFLPVPSLRELNLGNNRLLRLEPELMGALPRLQSLSVEGNALASLGPGVFENLPSLLSLKLGDNPWACSCGIQPLFQWLVENMDKVPEVNAVSCKRPPYLSHRPIISLGNGSFARCQEPWLHPQDYAFFLLIGPSTFLTSICVCILTGLLAVAYRRMAKVPHIQPGSLARFPMDQGAHLLWLARHPSPSVLLPTVPAAGQDHRAQTDRRHRALAWAMASPLARRLWRGRETTSPFTNDRQRGRQGRGQGQRTLLSSGEEQQFLVGRTISARARELNMRYITKTFSPAEVPVEIDMEGYVHGNPVRLRERAAYPRPGRRAIRDHHPCVCRCRKEKRPETTSSGR
ncbi:hypothetical protein JD844_005098 [Phrynosoma platyrhinos]|uniref:Uncharacterized protein n=1 Tax=Phrynosoma platyrhinos TaxID=52577 RepID=A0ABQ7SE80_PHRPL|nr:hypothetical protein JD844_005098 [Phrynosoma platyrhinos]